MLGARQLVLAAKTHWLDWLVLLAGKRRAPKNGFVNHQHQKPVCVCGREKESEKVSHSVVTGNRYHQPKHHTSGCTGGQGGWLCACASVLPANCCQYCPGWGCSLCCLRLCQSSPFSPCSVDVPHVATKLRSCQHSLPHSLLLLTAAHFVLKIFLFFSSLTAAAAAAGEENFNPNSSDSSFRNETP